MAANLGPGESRLEANKAVKSADEERLNYCMKLACLTAARCTGQTKVGVVIAQSDRKVVSTGYYENIEPTDGDHRDLYGCHAESNVLLNAAGTDFAGCTVYVTSFPCSVCLSQFIEVGITDVIYLAGPPRNEGPDGDAQILPEYRAADKLMTLMLKENGAAGKLRCRSYRDELAAISKSCLVPESPQKFEVRVQKQQGAADIYNVEHLHDDQYFMAMAYLAAKHSHDPYTKVGACIVDVDGRVIGLGYNALPAGCESILTWKGDREQKTNPDWINTKYPYVIHAITMAILNRNSTLNLKGSKLYVTHYPDYDCARLILQSGIAEVHYWSNEKKDELKSMIGKRMLEGDERAHIQLLPSRPAQRPAVSKFDGRQYATFSLPDEAGISVLEVDDLIMRRPKSAVNGGSQAVAPVDN